MSTSIQYQKQQIRESIRHKRQQLSGEQQAQSADKIFTHIKQQPWFTKQVQVAYHAFDGEINPQVLASNGVTSGQSVLHPLCNGCLLFIKITDKTQYITNRFGIQEPVVSVPTVLPLNMIDIVYVPLVAFDASGYRLGMGGGFYDRTFSGAFKRPLLIGLAHTFQHIDILPKEKTDIPLDAVVTPEKVWNFGA